MRREGRKIRGPDQELGGDLGLRPLAGRGGRRREPRALALPALRRAAERLGATLQVQGEYDAVIECAGNSAALARAAQLCRPGGTVVLLATYWEKVNLPALDVCMKQLTIKASSLYNRRALVRDVDIAAQLLAQRPELADILITHRLPLDAAPDAFAIAADRKAGAIKVVLEP